MLVKGDGYHTTVGELLQPRDDDERQYRATTGCCTYVGGPSAVRAMIARKQLGDIRFGPGERLLQAGTAGLDLEARICARQRLYASRARGWRPQSATRGVRTPMSPIRPTAPRRSRSPTRWRG